MEGHPSFIVGVEVSDNQVQNGKLPISFVGNFTVIGLTDSDVELFKLVSSPSRSGSQDLHYFFHESLRFSYKVGNVEAMEFEAHEF